MGDETESTDASENPGEDNEVIEAAPEQDEAHPQQKEAPPETYLVKVENIAELKQGMVVRRVGPEKVQQGGFVKLTDDREGMILLNVIDLKAGEFAAEAGVIKPEPGDEIFYHPDRAVNPALADKARQVLSKWALFNKYPQLQAQLIEFMEIAYSADHVMYLKRNEMLPFLFVPLQERFKIGKFAEKIDWDKVREDRFAEQLLGLGEGKHLTYVAFIPARETSNKPFFYSIGTKPHIETLKVLDREPFGFKPNRGGHIKIVSGKDEKPKRFVVDAGSNDLGRGVHTSVSVAEAVTDCLKEFFPDCAFKPLPGRDAFGLQQSW